MNKYLVFDMGGSSVKYAIVKENGEIINSSYFSRQSDFASLIEAMLDVYQNNKDIKGISISAPGAVDSKNGTIGGTSALPYIHGPNFKTIFKEKTGFDIAIENDANCAALSENYFGNGKNHHSLVYIVLGSGVGGSILHNDEILTGCNLHGGEFGYWIMNEHNQTWDELGATVPLINKINKKLNSNFDGKQVFDLYHSNSIVKEEIDKWFNVQARAIINIQYSIDPSIILIGGAISHNQFAMDGIIKTVNKISSSHGGVLNINVKVGKFKSEANLLGALANLLKQNN